MAFTTSKANFRSISARRRQAGTSLVEILVVIVIFLIGILAVVQVFPRGFRLLLVSRNNSVATQVGRAEVERMKSYPAGVPEQVLPVIYDNGVPRVNETLDPLALGPRGDAISQGGILTSGGANATNWMLASGANNARRIIGEGARVPAPRTIAANLNGGLMVLEHGPVAQNSPIVAYANDLSRRSGPPVEAEAQEAYTPANASLAVQARTPDGQGVLGVVPAQWVRTPATLRESEYFVVNAATPNATLLLPASINDRLYRIRLAGYAGTDAGGYSRVEWVSLSLFVPAKANTDARPLIAVSVANILAASNVLGGRNFSGLEYDTVRVSPQYIRMTVPMSADDLAIWLRDPFRVVVTDPILGCLLFSPAGRDASIDQVGGISEPLIAKVDYDVYDWRILREDFRSGNGTMSLALQGLKVGSETGPDGRKNGGLFDTAQWPAAAAIDPAGDVSNSDNYSRDNVVVVDLTTGYQVQDSRDAGNMVAGRPSADAPANSANAQFTVDKSRGVVQFTSNPIRLISPLGALSVDPANRTFRVLYRAKNEWAVQLVKSASNYSEVTSFQVGNGNFLVGGGVAGGSATRVYFPKSDIGRKVTIDRIVYRNAQGVQTLEGQDFIVRRPTVGSVPDLGYIDLLEVDASGTGGFVRTMGSGRLVEPVRGVKGASVMVRVLWNPEAFTLTANAAENLSRVDQWGRSWRRSTTETYLRAEESR